MQLNKKKNMLKKGKIKQNKVKSISNEKILYGVRSSLGRSLEQLCLVVNQDSRSWCFGPIIYYINYCITSYKNSYQTLAITISYSLLI